MESDWLRRLTEAIQLWLNFLHPVAPLDDSLWQRNSDDAGLSIELLELLEQALAKVLNLFGRDEVKVGLERRWIVAVVRDVTHCRRC